MRNSLAGLAGACGIILLIVCVIIARSVIAALAPFITVLIMIALACAFIAGIAGYIYHLWKMGALQRARYELDSKKLFPDQITGANYPIIYESDTRAMMQARPGVTIQPVPQTYSPHITYGRGGRDQACDEVVDGCGDQEQLPAPVQSFAELLQAGVIQTALAQGKMLLGYAAGALRYGSWLDLYSCGIGGVSGSGKTTTVRFLLFQAILASARLIMIDPHIGSEDESLAAQFAGYSGVHIWPPCDANTSDVLRRARYLTKELSERKATGKKTPFLVLVIDEFNAVMRNKETKNALSDLLVAIEQEGRKFGIFAMLMGQRWSAQDLGGADIRTSLASTLAHRFTDEDQARKLVGGRNGARCLELPTGHFLFRDTNGGITEMITPLTTIEDGAIIQSMLVSVSEASQKFVGNQGGRSLVASSFSNARNLLETSEASYEASEETTVETSDPIADKALQVVRLQAQGMVKADIMRIVWGVSPGASTAYKQADSEYQQVMQSIAKSLGVQA